MMTIYQNPDAKTISQILQRPLQEAANLEATVQQILQRVKTEGDLALKDLTRIHDKVDLQTLIVSSREIEEAEQLVSPELKAAIQTAQQNIRHFHETQQSETVVIETMPGVSCWQKSVCIEKVGLYIPGGTAPLISTVLMLGVPAQIANCKYIVLCTPPQQDGRVNPAILYAAKRCGIDQIFKVGGAQAIGAMAYGTESIPAVYKIFGPGNQYVTAAKQLVNRVGIAIDMPAGPSEVLVLAGNEANPEFVAADLLSQAEHGVDSQVVLLAYSQKMVEQILVAIEKQLSVLPRAAIARKALEKSPAIVVEQEEQVLDLINQYAPEHLILATDNAEILATKIQNAGSVFIGHYTPESVGDYASGTNHTLPTNGFARAYSGLNLDAFVKKITFQKLSQQGLQNIGETVERLATAEQLIAHKNAVSIRLANIERS